MRGGERIWERSGPFARFVRRAAPPPDSPQFRLRLEPEPATEGAPVGGARAPDRIEIPLRALVVAGLAIVIVALGVSVVGRSRGAAAARPAAGPVRVAAFLDLEAAGILYAEQVDAFLIYRPFEPPLALRARDAGHLDQRVFYCGTSGWFEDPTHGSVFDRHGFVRLGPTHRGLDRLRVVIEGGFIRVDPTVVEPGEPRGVVDGSQPRGPFCAESGAWLPRGPAG